MRPSRSGKVSLKKWTRRPSARVELGDAGLAAIELHLDDLEEVLRLRRQLAEAVDQLGRETPRSRRASRARSAPVEAHAQIEVRHIIVRDEIGASTLIWGEKSRAETRLAPPDLASRIASSSIDW
jgi:hypothetical protein